MAKSPTQKQLANEKKLYETFLDVWYANQSNEDIITDLSSQLKDMRKHQRKTKKSLKKISEIYTTIYGKEPLEPKKY